MSSSKYTALITGSGKNIGRACAFALAKAGCNVVVNGANDRTGAEAVASDIRALGADAIVAMGDVGKRKDAIRIAQAAIEAFGSVDVLVNNVAVRRDQKFLEMSEDDWRDAMAVNFDSTYWLSRACLPGMLQKRWGRIINFTGMNAMRGYDGWAHISAPKHAVWGLTKALAKEFGASGVTANAVSPGPVLGESHDPVMTAHISSMKARVPIGRVGTPAEIAAVVSFLASPDSSFVNGQMIQVNGGAES